MSILSIFKESTNSFNGQEPGEQVILLVRRHPFYITVKFIVSLVLIIVPFLVLLPFLPNLAEKNIAVTVLFFYSIWTLLLWIAFFYNFTMYTLDVWIVTDRRIIDSTQHGFFDRTVSELHVNRVQDISVEIDGFIQSLFGFGDIQVQTAGTEEKFKFIQVPNPEKIKNEIMSKASGKKQPSQI
jgi:uncharacterized membrane protein YdbT with pleckstrin-like domain